MANIQVLNGECFEVLNGIKTESVDALITDPPYNIARDNNFTSMGRTGIDFGDWDKDFDLVGWLPSAVKTVKKGGNIIVFTSWKSTTPIVEMLETLGCDVKDMIRVEKSNPMPRNRDRRFIVDYEIAIWAVKKGGKWTFNRLSATYERPLIKTCVTPKSEKLNGGHPTQKNVETMEWLIERLTNENDVVLDPFGGSGTTAFACQNLNRDCITIEKEVEYYEMIRERLTV